MPKPLSPLVVAPQDGEFVSKLLHEMGGQRWSQGRLQGTVVHVVGTRGDLIATVSRVAFTSIPLVYTPTQPPEPLAWWSRRVDRIVLPSQAVARAWAELVPLGRISVASTGEGFAVSLAAIYAEVSAQRRGRLAAV